MAEMSAGQNPRILGQADVKGIGFFALNARHWIFRSPTPRLALRMRKDGGKSRSYAPFLPPPVEFAKWKLPLSAPSHRKHPQPRPEKYFSQAPPHFRSPQRNWRQASTIR